MSSLEQKKHQDIELINSVLPSFTINDLISSGTHIGHRANAWNPKMKQFIYCERNGVHIIDARKTYSMLTSALLATYKAVSAGRSVLMVSTRSSFREIIKSCANKCGHPYVDYRWLGGMLTNWRTVALSIRKIKKYESILSSLDLKGRHPIYTKKELGVMTKKLARLKLYFGGLMNINSRPDLIISFDVTKDACAVLEANKLCIPVIGIVDTNASLEGIEYPVPCNDDSANSISFIADLFSQVILKAQKDSKKEDSEEIQRVAAIAKIADDIKKSVKKKSSTDAPYNNNSPESTEKIDVNEESHDNHA